MLGISTYFKDLDYNYLKRASDIGARYLFTSLHIPEEDLSNLDDVLPDFLQKVKEFGLTLVPDISPATFAKLGVAEGDYERLKELGFTALRLDYGFDDFNEVKKLQQDFELILNASVVNGDDLKEAIDAGVSLENMTVLHNFYPLKGTALPVDYFREINKDYAAYNIKTMAFVPGDKLKRFPLYEGLPTLEKHRSMHPYVAAVELMHDFDIDDILIGDSEAEFSTLYWIESYMKDNIIHLPTVLDSEHDNLYDKTFEIRKDLSETMIRLVSPRIPSIPILKNNGFKAGAITMENDLAGRYSGEIQIQKYDGFVPRSNVLGYIDPHFLDLLKYIDRNVKVKLVRP